MPARRISRLRVKELHAAGKADGEIAALLGCARSTVRAVRLLLRLKTNDRRYRGWTGREEKELATALSDGERYADIARGWGGPTPRWRSRPSSWNWSARGGAGRRRPAS